MSKSKTIALCSMVTAMSVALMFLGGLTSIMAYALPMILSLLMIMLKTTFSTKSAWITYFSTSLLSLLIVSDKECSLMYAFFFGFYPIIQSSLNKIKPFVVKLFVKLVVFNAMLAIVELLLVYVFNIPFLEDGIGEWFIIFFAVLMNVLFLVYDRLVIVCFALYKKKYEKIIKKMLR